MSIIQPKRLTSPTVTGSGRQRSYTKQHETDFIKMYIAMEKGHKVCKLNVCKKWDPAYKFLTLKQETRLLHLTKLEQGAVRSKPAVLDIRHIREVQTLDYKLNTIKIADKWKRDKEIQNFDASKILVISHGTGFTLSHWILLFETTDMCRVWSLGVHNLMLDTRDRDSSCHTIRIERFLAKQFDNLKSPNTDLIARKHMKPFVQTTLQYKAQSKQLQDITEDQMNLVQFSKATRKLIYAPEIIEKFKNLSEDGNHVTFQSFLRFLEIEQIDDMSYNRNRAIEFLRRYLHQDQDFNVERIEPSLTIYEFADFLFSRENSVWDYLNEKVTQDMTRPLSHYFIASSHNTYLTGDQLRSESSLDSYAQALLMGCRCIELDCWDGQKKSNSSEFLDIVIYHGYTMTSKLLLRDVLYTIRHYAFITSEYPVILSIEDNCSVPAQRLLALEVKEILGDYLLTSPVSRDENQLPSPAALKKKIILKHKKLPIESEDLASFVSNNDEFEDSDILAKDCVKRGVLHLRDETIHEWRPHVFVLFPDRLCYLLDAAEDIDISNNDTISMIGDEDREEEQEALPGFGIRPEEMHVTEEWFHGRCGRQEAVQRILQHKEKGNGTFMIRDSNLFIGDYSLSILHDGVVHHVRISTKMVDREKKYYFMENKVCDTLYELVSYYMRHYLMTKNFNMVLKEPCPQPQPHLNMPWFSATADKAKAEELLNRVNEDGAFLIRTSSSDPGVFVLSLRVDGEIWHYRLKRNGRIFVVNQTVWENLNLIVEYYSTREFVRGISLRIPVNEEYAEQFASAETTEQAPGTYIDIRDLDKEVQARALRPYHGKNDDELTFPANAIITVLRKEEGLWRGRYGSSTGWFPSSYVQELLQEKMSSQETTNYNTIELAGTSVERTSDSDRPYALRISHGTHWNGSQWLLSTNSLEELEDWHNQLLDITRSANDKLSHLRIKEKTARIAAELSNLVVYCQAVPFDPAHIKEGSFYEMCSFVENKLDKLLEKGLVQFNMRQLSRVYPHGSRITSANYNPIPMWNASCHMVALNYQTGDKPMQLNQGKFLANGQCGYVLKPDYMLDENFDPINAQKVTTSCPIRLSVQVIAGRHLSRKDKNKGICSPFVEIELIGMPCDEKVYRTKTIASNGLNPIWQTKFVFEIHCPEVALLKFTVEDGDFLGGPKTDPFIGQAVFPVDCLRCGYRSVPLKNQFSEELELSALLIDLQMQVAETGAIIQSARSVLQASRLASVHKKITASDSLNSPSAPRQMAPRLQSLENRHSIESHSPSSSSLTAMDERKLSNLSLQGSQDSTETASVNGNGPYSAGHLHKKKKNFFSKLVSFRSREREEKD